MNLIENEMTSNVQESCLKSLAGCWLVVVFYLSLPFHLLPYGSLYCLWSRDSPLAMCDRDSVGVLLRLETSGC